MVLISVIVLCFNDEKYIRRCLESILHQTYPNIELIVIDDCSSDNTWSEVAMFDKEDTSKLYRIKTHRNIRNIGSASSRNLGLDLATGDYITFIDGDDWIEPSGIEHMATKATESNADIVMSDFVIDKDNSKTIEAHNETARLSGTTNIEIIKALLIGKLHGSTCTRVYRAQFIESVNARFVDGADYTEDLAFNVKLMIHTNNIETIEIPYYHYCVRPDSMSNSTSSNTKDFQKIINVRSISENLENSELREYVQDELNYLKLESRMPLLNSLTKENCKLWQQTFPESNSVILKDNRMGLIYRIQLLLLVLNLPHCFLLISKMKRLWQI